MPKVTIYVAEELWAEVKAAGFSVSPVCQAALRDEVERARMKTELEMEKLSVAIEGPHGTITKSFIGRWLVTPDRDESRGSEGDAGAYYGVALTARGRIAVWVGHVNEEWEPRLEVFESIDEAALPENIASAANAELGNEIILDI
jgi:hypothetical protein